MRVSEPVPIKYRAFLSYSHRDKKWGEWLQHALERIRIDKDLVGRQTTAGPVPKTLRPIFRDREDFSAGPSLTGQTLAALEASQFLIVICSPNAAHSKYVNEEVRRFKMFGHGERVIPVIIDGEPGDPTLECFPPALRYKVGVDGQITNERELLRLLPAGALPGGTCTHWKAPPCHGAHPEQTLAADRTANQNGQSTRAFAVHTL